MNFKSEILARFKFFLDGGHQIFQQTADKIPTLNVCIFNQIPNEFLNPRGQILILGTDLFKNNYDETNLTIQVSQPVAGFLFLKFSTVIFLSMVVVKLKSLLQYTIETYL